jgi:hypothetical protein
MYFTQFINTYQDVICSEKRIGIDANHTGDGERILSSIANRVSESARKACGVRSNAKVEIMTLATDDFVGTSDGHGRRICTR